MAVSLFFRKRYCVLFFITQRILLGKMTMMMMMKTALVVFAFLSTNYSLAFSPPTRPPQRRDVGVGNNHNNNNAFVLRVPPRRSTTNGDYNGNQIVENNVAIPTRKHEGLNGYSFPTGADRYHDMLDERGLFIQRIFSPRSPVPVIASSNNEENEDGWEEMRKAKPLPMWKKMAKLPFRVYNKVVARENKQEPGTLILVRHGESKWNGEGIQARLSAAL
jgi:hypothetical protein